MKEFEQFKLYAEAVNAERYRVTVIKMEDDGSKRGFVLDKRDGVTRGFTPEEMRLNTPEMVRLQRRGENIYYTPLSDKKHHILVDDMDMQKLSRLIQDGYKPAVILESSPHNYQAIITIPKLGSEYDKDVGNRVSEMLNRRYGDPKLSGAIHPHRAPGYQNRKPKHRRADGTYPEVRLLKHERRECAKTFELSKQIEAEYRQKAMERARQKVSSVDKPLKQIDFSPSDELSLIYQKHYESVVKICGGGDLDLSRVDSMIAVRMRVTGHTRAQVANAIRYCAPLIRHDKKSHDWDSYAERTADYAFSPRCDDQVKELKKYKSQWLRLEGRKRPRERSKGLSR